MSKTRLLPLLALLLTVGHSYLQANNGALAYIYPLSNISIDGDLSLDEFNLPAPRRSQDRALLPDWTRALMPAERPGRTLRAMRSSGSVRRAGPFSTR